MNRNEGVIIKMNKYNTNNLYCSGCDEQLNSLLQLHECDKGIFSTKCSCSCVLGECPICYGDDCFYCVNCNCHCGQIIIKKETK